MADTRQRETGSARLSGSKIDISIRKDRRPGVGLRGQSLHKKKGGEIERKHPAFSLS